MFIKSGAVTLKNFTLSHGKAKGGNSTLGGGHGCFSTHSGCDNAGDGYGGGIFVKAGTVTLQDVSFSGNSTVAGSGDI